MYHCIQRYSARPIPRGRNRTNSATLSQDWRCEISEICREADTSNSALKFTQLKTQFNKMARCQIRFCHKKLNLCQARFSCSACPHAFLCFATFAALLFSPVQHLLPYFSLLCNIWIQLCCSLSPSAALLLFASALLLCWFVLLLPCLALCCYFLCTALLLARPLHLLQCQCTVYSLPLLQCQCPAAAATAPSKHSPHSPVSNFMYAAWDGILTPRIYLSGSFFFFSITLKVPPKYPIHCRVGHMPKVWRMKWSRAEGTSRLSPK